MQFGMMENIFTHPKFGCVWGPNMEHLKLLVAMEPVRTSMINFTSPIPGSFDLQPVDSSFVKSSRS